MPSFPYPVSHQNAALPVTAFHHYPTSNRRVEDCSLGKQTSLRKCKEISTTQVQHSFTHWCSLPIDQVHSKTHRAPQQLFCVSLLSPILSHEQEPMITSHLNKDFYEKKIKANKHTTKQKLKSEGTRSMYGAETN